MNAVKRAFLFVKNYDPEQKQKGLYFYGKFGVGKSYLLGAIANELAKKRISSMIVYVPELFRELKSSIGDSTLNEKIEALKKNRYLCLMILVQKQFQAGQGMKYLDQSSNFACLKICRLFLPQILTFRDWSTIWPTASGVKKKK